MTDQVPDINAGTGLSGHLDIYATGMATLCLLHCLALPFLAAALPFSVYLIDNHWFHQLIVLLAAPATLWIISSARPSGLFTATALCGLALLLLGAFVEALELYEEPLTVAGSVLLGSAHLWRWLRHRSAASDAEDETAAGAELK